MVLLSGIFDVKNSNMLYDCISKNGLMVIFGAFFFFCFLYILKAFFLNIIIKPKKKILYLYKDENNYAYFLDNKGKKYFYGECENEENCYYYVLKTRDYIYGILEKTNEDWTPKEKKSYWLTFYSPIGDFENLLLLPIIYVMLLPAILSFLMSKGYIKIYGIMFGIVPVYLIVYDLIHKINSNKGN